MKTQHVDNPIYGNCKVTSPDGILMFRCDEKKVNWYLKRNLAEMVSDSPLTIRLLFNPNGLGNHDKDWGLDEMKNVCVCCGSELELTRHHVVPYCYRKYFPLDLKSHNFHDVLPMCIEHHENYERKADELKKYLAIKYDAPLFGVINQNRDLIKYIKLSNTLLNEELVSKIPKDRLDFIISEFKLFFNVEELTNEKLIEISKYPTFSLNKTHGEMVVDKIDNIQEFIEMWRKHFIESNNPKYLPTSWNKKSEKKSLIDKILEASNYLSKPKIGLGNYIICSPAIANAINNINNPVKDRISKIKKLFYLK